MPRDRTAYHRGWLKRNRARHNANSLRWRQENHERAAEHKRRSRLKTLYGITADAYASLLAGQGGGCAICGSADSKKRLAVDHSHETGNVRGLLCSNCNVGLGMLRDSPDILRKALAYLLRSKRLGKRTSSGGR